MQGKPEQRTKETRESEGRIGARKPANGKAPGAGGAKAARAESGPPEGNATAAQTAEVAYTGLWGIGKLAKQNPRLRFNSLAHWLTVGALWGAFQRLRRNAAVGVDGVTVEQYGQHIEENLAALHGRLRAGTYRHQPIRRVHIPKAPGKTRPIGVSCVEDKLVQQGLREILEMIYEQDFYDCSYGFRPGRGAHDALRALDQMAMCGEANWILEADIQAFFDSIDRKVLMEMLSRRVADGRLLRLVGKCLHVGVLDGEEYSEPEVGTAQGSVLSPLLGNVYLHYVLDEWFAQEVQPRLAGKARLIRYADDFVIGFQNREDAERVLRVLHQRMGKHGLKLHPEKTRLVPFERPRWGQPKDRRSGTFDFLGFTVHWRRTRREGWSLGMKTRKARARKAVQGVYEFCRRHRHEAVEEQHKGLRQRLEGHFNYFGVNGNSAALTRVANAACRAWHKWLNRRSQRGGMKWKRFRQVLQRLPLPEPTIRVQLWSTAA